MKRLIDDGKLGKIQAARTHVIMQGPQKSWMNDANAGGGVLLLNSIHHIDLLRYYVGDIKRVSGVCRSVQPQMENGAEDLATANIEFENGAIGDVFASWTSYLSPDGAFYLVLGSEGTVHSTHQSAGRRNDSPLRHFGTIMYAPKVELDRSKESDRRKMVRPPFEPIDSSGIDLPSTNYFVNEILHFEECCRTGKEPISSGRDNIESMKVVLGIFESSRTGKAVDLDDL